LQLVFFHACVFLNKQELISAECCTVDDDEVMPVDSLLTS